MKFLSICGLLIFLISTGCSKPVATVTVELDSPAVRGSTISENIGIETLGGVMTPLLFNGCAIPCRTSEIFSTAADNQKQIEVTMFRGLKDIASQNVRLGKYVIRGIPNEPRGVPQIEVFFEAVDGKIILSAVDISKGSELSINQVE